MAELLGAPLAIVDKRRPAPGVSEVMHVIGSVRGRTAILMDDIVDTAGTIVHAAEALREMGARDVFAACVHPVLSGPAVDRLAAAPIRGVAITNSIPVSERAASALGSRLTCLSIAPLLGEAIVRVHEDRSVSELMTARPRAPE
jgi:ribose-phosphate pyrophosphokinase